MRKPERDVPAMAPALRGIGVSQEMAAGECDKHRCGQWELLPSCITDTALVTQRSWNVLFPSVVRKGQVRDGESLPKLSLQWP